MDVLPAASRALAVSIVLVCLTLLSPHSSASDDDVCGTWSLHGYRIGMDKEEALEVDIEGNPGANVVAVHRKGRRITFRYADGGGGRVLFDSEDRVQAIESSRTAPWDRVVPPPKMGLRSGQPQHLFWLDDTCDVGAVATRGKGLRVTSAAAFRSEWENRYDLNVPFETASSYGLQRECLRGDLPCVCWCYDRWGSPIGDCRNAARFLEAQWHHYLASFRTQPWRVDSGRAADTGDYFRNGVGSGRDRRSGGSSASSSTGASSSWGRGSSSSRGSSSWGRGSSSSGGSSSQDRGTSSSSGGGSGAGSIRRR